MVSIHNTHEFHNYITSLPVQTPQTNPNTILSYLETNYQDIYNVVNNNLIIRNKLNNPSFKYTLFLPTTDFNYDNLLDHIFKGEFVINEENQYIIVSEGGIMLNVDGNVVNGNVISQTNVMLNNGIIHII